MVVSRDTQNPVSQFRSVAARIYDRGTLFHIKDSMESYFDSWNSYRRMFPPPFVCSAPECTPLYILVGQSEEKEKGNRGQCSGETEKVPKVRFLAVGRFPVPATSSSIAIW